MIDISRVGVSSESGRIYTRFKEDLLSVFEGYETEVDETLDTLKIYLNDSKTMYLICEYIDNHTLNLTLRYSGGNATIINYNGYDNLFDYHMIKFDNGVIGLSRLCGYRNIGDPHPYANNYGYITIFFANCTNVATGESEMTVFDVDNSDRDNATGYNMRADKSQVRDWINFAYSTDNVINSAMTVIVPAYGHSRPLTTDKLWLKLQSQQQFGEIVLGGKKYMSCCTFCVPLE